MLDLFTNTSSRKDFFLDGLIKESQKDMGIYIASAFFTEIDVIDELVQKDCRIRIIMRLGFPTSPVALKYLLKHKNIEARFYTNHAFHPKLYILGNKKIFVGSANLTKAALLTNQEIMVGILPDDLRFEELTYLFLEYWEEAKVLTFDEIEKYEKIYKKYKDALDALDYFDDEVQKVIGDHNFNNIQRYNTKQKNSELFFEDFLKTYQESVHAYKYVEEEYKKKGRKVDKDLIPLRLEIDSFFSFVRDCHAVHDTWENQSIGWGDNNRMRLNTLIDEWMNTDWFHFEQRIVKHNYPFIMKTLGSANSINQATASEIVDALCMVHSFHDRLRFFKGGLNTLKDTFLQQNELSKIKNTLAYLLHDKKDTIGRRIANCIYNPDYKLDEFGQSNVQELIGWINNENMPVINGRTTKVLRYFGFDVR
ncbi:phospholipase D family protein [Acinetobacter pollinis]|jgi:HKD family nuclease|uniref:phospholipase D family protein n=1 Tax=Acinetobacter pollinis TaxID=2605270 RepID=UPI0018C206A6|nr:phospholipase D family protein [Acinetobacter pollinis]MBF7694216.1 phospholipase D family protein [Acinetobacter pollinis]MBF7701808.1 phospholipase D family protein [Acinetobacter pollinis]